MMKRIRELYLPFALLLLLLCQGCGKERAAYSPQEQQTAQHEEISGSIALPEIPLMLTTSESRMEYLTLHYWDRFRFTDSLALAQVEQTEQHFTDFIHLLGMVETATAQKAIGAMMEQAATDRMAYQQFSLLYEKYLYEVNSPYRDEQLYLTVLQHILANEQLDELHKMRSRFQLSRIMMNQVGVRAADFYAILSSGKTVQMSAIRAEYLVLFFNDPDCSDCVRMKEELEQFTLNNPQVKVLAIYLEEDVKLWRATIYPSEWINAHVASSLIDPIYDLRAIPSLYLLDREKRVLLKDTDMRGLINYFEKER